MEVGGLQLECPVCRYDQFHPRTLVVLDGSKGPVSWQAGRYFVPVSAVACDRCGSLQMFDPTARSSPKATIPPRRVGHVRHRVAIDDEVDVDDEVERQVEEHQVTETPTDAASWLGVDGGVGRPREGDLLFSDRRGEDVVTASQVGALFEGGVAEPGADDEDAAPHEPFALPDTADRDGRPAGVGTGDLSASLASWAPSAPPGRAIPATTGPPDIVGAASEPAAPGGEEGTAAALTWPGAVPPLPPLPPLPPPPPPPAEPAGTDPGGDPPS